MVTTTSNLTSRKTSGHGTRRLIGIHTMEAPESGNTAENVANYFKTVDASAHWCVDNNSRVRSVSDSDTAWTMPPVNSVSYNVEIAGYAKQTPADWQDQFSIDALEIAALCVAEWCKKDGIPVKHLTSSQIKNGSKGIAGHVDVNNAYHSSSHWDPGPHFPWTYFLGRVNEQLKGLGGGTPSPTPDSNWNNEGYSQSWIKSEQHKLNQVGYELDEDGILGNNTRKATKDFQSKHNLKQDGIPGKDTDSALDRVIKQQNDAASKPKPKPSSKPNCEALQKAVRVTKDNAWGSDTDKHCNAVREASAWGGVDFPYGVDFTQRVVGTEDDGVWGDNSRAAHDATTVNVQKALKAMGFNPGDIDGIWGDKTEKAYQSARKACHI